MAVTKANILDITDSSNFFITSHFAYNKYQKKFTIIEIKKPDITQNLTTQYSGQFENV